MRTVVVVANKSRPFTHASVPFGGATTRRSSKRLFCFPLDNRTPHDSKTSAWGRGRKGYTVCNRGFDDDGWQVRSRSVWCRIRCLASKPMHSQLIPVLCADRNRNSHHHQVHGLGGSSRIIRAAGRIIKPRGVWSIHSMMILRCRGEAPSLSTLLLWGRGVFG